jgi:hypothetical protein
MYFVPLFPNSHRDHINFESRYGGPCWRVANVGTGPNEVGWLAQLVNLVELKVKELEIQGSSSGKGEKLIL